MTAALFAGCNGGGNKAAEPVSLKFDTVAGNRTFAVETQQIDSGYGYTVSVNGKKLIQQTIVPVIEGKHRFVTAQDALNTGKVVVGKMISTADLPSLTKEDLIMLGVLSQDGTLITTK